MDRPVAAVFNSGGFNSSLLLSFVTTEKTLIGCGIPRPTVDAFCGRAGEMHE